MHAELTRTEMQETIRYEDEMTEAYDEYVEMDLPHEDDYYDIPTGRQRVIRLLLILLVALLVVGVLLFGIIPYVQALTTPQAIPLPPAVQV